MTQGPPTFVPHNMHMQPDACVTHSCLSFSSQRCSLVNKKTKGTISHMPAYTFAIPWSVLSTVVEVSTKIRSCHSLTSSYFPIFMEHFSCSYQLLHFPLRGGGDIHFHTLNPWSIYKRDVHFSFFFS